MGSAAGAHLLGRKKQAWPLQQFGHKASATGATALDAGGPCSPVALGADGGPSLLSSICNMADHRLYKIVRWCKSLPLFGDIQGGFGQGHAWSTRLMSTKEALSQESSKRNLGFLCGYAQRANSRTFVQAAA
ncbi:uncharacterized protein LOC144110367 [Amblyomma americanum]